MTRTAPAWHETPFWDRVADRYARSKIGDLDAYEEKLRLNQALLRADAQVLELGCGTGMTAVRHAPHAARVHATDMSEKMLDHGRRRAAEAGVDNVTFERATVETLQAPAGAYDAVLAMSLMHLVEDQPAALRRIRDWLRPGGAFVSSTVCLADGLGFLRPVLPVLRWLGRAPHVHFLRREAWIRTLREAGFEVERDWRPGRRAAVFVVARKPA
ncbi:MAG: class I SAM-dependent methyltransferase [Pseudomonadota bacterium]